MGFLDKIDTVSGSNVIKKVLCTWIYQHINMVNLTDHLVRKTQKQNILIYDHNGRIKAKMGEKSAKSVCIDD